MKQHHARWVLDPCFRVIRCALLLCMAVLSLSTAGCGNSPTGSEQVAAARGALEATVHVLSGTVFGAGAAMPGTPVEAQADGTTTVVASATTDPSGVYAISLADGVYDLRITPPAGSGFAQQMAQNVTLSGADKRDDIVLIAKGGAVVGHVRGYGGVGMLGVAVYAYDPATGTGITSGSWQGRRRQRLRLRRRGKRSTPSASTRRRLRRVFGRSWPISVTGSCTSSR